MSRDDHATQIQVCIDRLRLGDAIGARRAAGACLGAPRAPDAEDAPGLPRRPALGADRRRLAERGHAALSRAERGPAADGRRLLPAGGGADPPRVARPGPALLGCPWPGRPSLQPRRWERRPLVRGVAEPAGLDLRPRSSRRLERLPSRGRGPAGGGARDVRPAVLPGAVAGRGGRHPGRLGAHDEAPMAVRPVAADRRPWGARCPASEPRRDGEESP